MADTAAAPTPGKNGPAFLSHPWDWVKESSVSASSYLVNTRGWNYADAYAHGAINAITLGHGIQTYAYLDQKIYGDGPVINGTRHGWGEVEAVRAQQLTEGSYAIAYGGGELVGAIADVYAASRILPMAGRLPVVSTVGRLARGALAIGSGTAMGVGTSKLILDGYSDTYAATHNGAEAPSAITNSTAAADTIWNIGSSLLPTAANLAMTHGGSATLDDTGAFVATAFTSIVSPNATAKELQTQYASNPATAPVTIPHAAPTEQRPPASEETPIADEKPGFTPADYQETRGQAARVAPAGTDEAPKSETTATQSAMSDQSVNGFYSYLRVLAGDKLPPQASAAFKENLNKLEHDFPGSVTRMSGEISRQLEADPGVNAGVAMANAVRTTAKALNLDNDRAIKFDSSVQQTLISAKIPAAAKVAAAAPADAHITPTAVEDTQPAKAGDYKPEQTAHQPAEQPKALEQTVGKPASPALPTKALSGRSKLKSLPVDTPADKLNQLEMAILKENDFRRANGLAQLPMPWDPNPSNKTLVVGQPEIQALTNGEVTVTQLQKKMEKNRAEAGPAPKQAVSLADLKAAAANSEITYKDVAGVNHNGKSESTITRQAPATPAGDNNTQVADASAAMQAARRSMPGLGRPH